MFLLLFNPLILNCCFSKCGAVVGTVISSSDNRVRITVYWIYDHCSQCETIQACITHLFRDAFFTETLGHYRYTVNLCLDLEKIERMLTMVTCTTMDNNTQEKRRKKDDKAKEKHERNGGYSQKHVRLAEALAEKRASAGQVKREKN